MHIKESPDKKAKTDAFKKSIPYYLGIEYNVGLINSYITYNYQELEDEIVFMNSVLNKDTAIWSLSIAQHFNLAYTQLKIAAQTRAAYFFITY